MFQDIPIPVVTTFCRFGCCTRTFLPLELSFARTIHKFQGLQAGPVDDGKLPNMFPRIICDPDVKQAEGRATGLFYTAISRATTLGDAGGLNSAIYFTGPHLTRDRIQQVTLKANTNRPLENVRKRRDWVDVLESNTVVFPNEATESLNNTLEWVSVHKVPYDVLYRRSQQYATVLIRNKGTCNAGKI